jgi:hypothetical protein
MGFHSRLLLAVLLWIVPWGKMAVAEQGRGGPEITVVVQSSAEIPLAVLNQAEAEAGRIFHAAGVEILWVDCVRGIVIVNDACLRVPGTNDFVLHIVSRGRTTSDLVFGLAFLDQGGAGKYSDIFFDRVEQAHRKFGANVSSLLGTVAAHELGHLLLGAHAHSNAGIMTAVWKGEILKQVDMGTLLFTHEQASLMGERIRSVKEGVASVGHPPGAAAYPFGPFPARLRGAPIPLGAFPYALGNSKSRDLF